MYSMEKDAGFVQDREDLIFILRKRFGNVSSAMIQKIYEMDDVDNLNRLILVASNAPTYSVFLEEAEEGKDAFRIVGERFNPIEMMGREEDDR